MSYRFARRAIWSAAIATFLMSGSLALAQRPSAKTLDKSEAAAETPSSSTTSSSSTSSSAGGARGRTAGASAYVAPTAIGYVLAYEPGKSITVDVRKNRQQSDKHEFQIVASQTKIILPKGVKALEIGMVVSVWGDKAGSAAKYGKMVATKITAAPATSLRGQPQPAAPAPTTRRGASPRSSTPSAPSAPTSTGRRSAN